MSYVDERKGERLVNGKKIKKIARDRDGLKNEIRIKLRKKEQDKKYLLNLNKTSWNGK